MKGTKMKGTKMTDIRWHQRLSNFTKALAQLSSAVELSRTRALSELEMQGMIQAFEFTHELSWNVMKDYLTDQDGGLSLGGSKDATRLAFSRGLISSGEVWMEMIKDRNLSSHTYDQKTVLGIVSRITVSYLTLFSAFQAMMESKRGE
jgi:nucleotidyltransferase substrate binding protein (TIGR01987 family)